MKVATILPQAHIHLTKQDDYHMALAHLIGAPGFEQYTNFYKAVGRRDKAFLIMDNGVIEGNPRPISELLQKAKLVNADELVLPDVYQDMQATLRDAKAGFNYMDEFSDTEIAVMAVPQGATYDQWLVCAKEMLTWPIQTLGIPKMLCSLNGRDGRLDALIDLQSFLGNVQTHLLGCWESPLEVKAILNYVRQGKIKPVRGVDSAIAYVYAQAGIKMCDDERPKGAVDFGAAVGDLPLLKFNIDMWRTECGGLPELDDNNPVHRLFI